MNVLIIFAHPSSKGFSRQIAKYYKKGAEESGKNVETIDLYSKEYHQDFLYFENIRDWSEGEEERTKIQEKMTWADEYVFVHPLWWGGPPAILKNFIDQNFTSGFAFRYVRRKYIPRKLNLLPKGLLKDKKARLYITCDAPLLMYYLLFLPFVTVWFFFIFLYSGIKLRSFKVFDQMRWASETKKEQWLEKVYKTAKK